MRIMKELLLIKTINFEKCDMTSGNLEETLEYFIFYISYIDLLFSAPNHIPLALSKITH